MKAFKIITSFKHYDKMYSLENWPENVLIKRFRYNKKIINNRLPNVDNKETENQKENNEMEVYTSPNKININNTANTDKN